MHIDMTASMSSPPETRHANSQPLPSSGDLHDSGEEVADVIEDEGDLSREDSGEDAAFSPARTFQQFGRVATEGFHRKEEQAELLTPEAQAQLPHPR
jgi:hypothetical protein